MKRYFVLPVLVLSLAGLPALVGCDRTVSEEKSVKQGPDGSSVEKSKTEVKTSEGDTKTTTEKKSTDDDGDVKVEKKTETKTNPD
jgi:hypothetical protein